MTRRRSRPAAAHETHATPLDPDELEGLVPTHLQTQEELNQWEAANIDEAERWASRNVTHDPLSVEALRDLHRRMLDQTWRWAGSFRQRLKNISPVRPEQISEQLSNLVANVREQHAHSDRSAESLDELALRFHHQLVRIHPWPNGNGRHARLATDLLLRKWGRPRFTWGSGRRLAGGEIRSAYIGALKSADGGDYRPLRAFVRSSKP